MERLRFKCRAAPGGTATKMKPKLFAAIVTVMLAAVVLLACSSASTMLVPADPHAKENSRAPEHSPAISDNWGLERADFVHYARPGASSKPAKGDPCYKLLGVKWSALPAGYVINPYNPQNLSSTFVTSAISASAETWDAATSKELFDDAYAVDYAVTYGVQDFVNAISFGDYPDSNVIAVTSIWYTRVGKRIVEFDMLFNTRFAWGDGSATATGPMDLQNIATHEFGHGLGLGDIYTAACSQVTMYGYSGYGETIKRTLEQADMAGLHKMYGA